MALWLFWLLWLLASVAFWFPAPGVFLAAFEPCSGALETVTPHSANAWRSRDGALDAADDQAAGVDDAVDDVGDGQNPANRTG